MKALCKVESTHKHKNCICTHMLIAALFSIAKVSSNSNVHQLMKGKRKYGLCQNRILFSLKKKWDSDACYTVDEA